MGSQNILFLPLFKISLCYYLFPRDNYKDKKLGTGTVSIPLPGRGPEHFQHGPRLFPPFLEDQLSVLGLQGPLGLLWNLVAPGQPCPLLPVCSSLGLRFLFLGTHPRGYFLAILKGWKPLLRPLRQECCQGAGALSWPGWPLGSRVSGSSLTTFSVTEEE